MARQLPTTIITQDQYDALIKDLRGKIWVIMKSMKILLEKSGTFSQGMYALREESHSVAIGALYTHALEQLGKLMMVNSCAGTFDGTNYDLSAISENFYNHDEKIKMALDNIDNRCLDIFKNSSQGSTANTIDLDLRLKLLHSDIDNNGDIEEVPPIDVDKMKNVIEIFHTAYLGE